MLGARTITCLRSRQTDSLRVIYPSELVRIGRASDGDRGKRGGEVHLPRCSRRGHATGTYPPQSESAGEPPPAAASRCDLPHSFRFTLSLVFNPNKSVLSSCCLSSYVSLLKILVFHLPEVFSCSFASRLHPQVMDGVCLSHPLPLPASW